MDSFLFYAVVGMHKNRNEWVQSIHLDYDKAYTQYMANGMSGISSGGWDWRIERCYGISNRVVNKSLTDKEWDNFGYNSNEPCDICGDTNTRLEPRFYYATCREHASIPPVERERYKKGN